MIATSVLATEGADHLRALQLLRRVCRRGGDHAGLARASLSLSALLHDTESRIELLREAAALLDGKLGQRRSNFFGDLARITAT